MSRKAADERRLAPAAWLRDAAMGPRAAALAAVLSLPALPGLARAGIPECNNVRLEDVTAGGCELRASGSCRASCDRFGVYKKACATQLHQVCRNECTLSADATCSDECTVRCEGECDRGVNITCQHNCFGECNGSCDVKCAGAADNARCRASCEATCDGECDVRCRPVVDGSCYTHCIECCGGSCTAQANMDCQTTCQDEEFETCEHELEIDCSASCQVDGALFCNGEYILSGPELANCVEALITRGTLEVSGQVDGELTLGSPGKTVSGAGCSTSRVASGPGGLGAALLGLWLVARRRRRA